MDVDVHPRCRNRDAKYARGHEEHVVRESKHSQREDRKRLQRRAVQRARDHKVAEAEAVLLNSSSDGTNGSLPLVKPPARLHSALVRADRRVKHMLARLDASPPWTYGDVVRTLALCLLRHGLPRDVRRCVCQWVSPQRIVMLGGVTLLPTDTRTAVDQYGEARYDGFSSLSWKPCHRVLSIDPLRPGSTYDLAPLPVALSHVRTALNAATRELLVLGVPLVGHDKADDENIGDDDDANLVVLALALHTNTWRTVATPLPIHRRAMVAWAGGNQLVVCNALNANRHAVIDYASQSIKWLPPCLEQDLLTRARPLVVGDLLFVLFSTSRCLHVQDPDACPCCAPIIRNTPDRCCSSLQMLDLTRPNDGWVALSVPDVHLADSSLRKCIFERCGNTLYFCNLALSTNGLLSVFCMALDQRVWEGTAHWEEIPSFDLQCISSLRVWSEETRIRLGSHLHLLGSSSVVCVAPAAPQRFNGYGPHCVHVSGSQPWPVDCEEVPSEAMRAGISTALCV